MEYEIVGNIHGSKLVFTFLHDRGTCMYVHDVALITGWFALGLCTASSVPCWGCGF